MQPHDRALWLRKGIGGTFGNRCLFIPQWTENEVLPSQLFIESVSLPADLKEAFSDKNEIWTKPKKIHAGGQGGRKVVARGSSASVGGRRDKCEMVGSMRLLDPSTELSAEGCKAMTSARG